MIFVDSDVFLIDLRYPRDERATDNHSFLRRIRDRGVGATTIFNVLEVCGILSFNLNPRQLHEVFAHFPRRYGVTVVPAYGADAWLPQLPVSSILRVMEQRASFGDAQIVALLRNLRSRPEAVVTWNVEHFSGRLDARVLTPAQHMML